MKKIFVNGTFDILHIGHVKLLSYARSLGDELLVAIDSDPRVKILKGYSRPIYSQLDRKEILENLKSVNQVKIFNTDQELISIIKEYSPDIMVKGSDYINKPIIGSNLVRNIVFFERLNEYSTTNTIQNIVDR